MRRAPPPPGRSRQMATYGQLTSWAGPGRVTRLRREDVAGRRIPDAMKVPLVETGIPVAPGSTPHRARDDAARRRPAPAHLRWPAPPPHRAGGPRRPGRAPLVRRRTADRHGPLRPAGRRNALRQLGDRPVAGHPSPLRHPRHHLVAPRRARRP
ncbi:SUKH-4 family immunity protein [Streptomyces albidoflavus]|uniref:SUKH-4 family immunity protein n=1 Tax=Streptomyces albidoflavus TaxID=1886 RepID=UPI0038D1CF91